MYKALKGSRGRRRNEDIQKKMMMKKLFQK